MKICHANWYTALKDKTMLVRILYISKTIFYKDKIQDIIYLIDPDFPFKFIFQHTEHEINVLSVLYLPSN